MDVHPADLTRRGWLRAGSIGLGGLTLPNLLRLERTAAMERTRPAKSVIVLYLGGGPAHMDMWDLKPHAPAEVRGPFHPIDTNVAGVRVTEHMPRMARHADRYSIVRSMCHRSGGHPRANYWMMTGFPLPPTRRAKLRSLSREDHPHVGAALARVLGFPSGLPSFVMLPMTIHPTGPTEPHPGQGAGFLGPAYDPYLIDSDPNHPQYVPGPLRRHADITDHRLAARRRLLERFGRVEQGRAVADFSVYYEQAMDLVSSSAVQAAFNIRAEPDRVRARYGRHIFGQSVLLARRLIEAGIRLVHVNWPHQQFDTHGNHFPQVKNRLLPPVDVAYSALLEDLLRRGRLDDTLVIMMGEFGRTPKVNKNAGRDHWPQCFSLVLAGGGIRGGQLYGSSDNIAAYPASDPVSPHDLMATLYRCLGVDPHTTIDDLLGRKYPLSDGRPIDRLL